MARSVVAFALALAALLAALAGTAFAVETAPKVVKQPVAKTVTEGQSASFEATASGTPAPTVQWEVSTNGGSTYSPISGATSTVYTIASTTFAENGDKFRAVFTNKLGSATSTAVALTVRTNPVVTKQPEGKIVEEGQNAVFEAAATGSPAPTVLWETSADGGKTWSVVPGGTSTTLTLAKVKTTLSGHLYRATFSNSATPGEAVTESALLVVQKKPAVTKSPASVTVNEGKSATFEAAASGFPAPTVQWELSTNGGGTWAPIEGATSTTLSIAATTLAENGDQFRALFTNAAGTATSAAATLTVQQPPEVTLQPTGLIVEEGQPASFEAAASGTPTPTVQWEQSVNGGTTWTAISGATSGKFTIASAKTSESGHELRATFTNAAGKATTNAVTLTVQKKPAVTKSPTSTTANEGQNVTFESAASGFPTPTVQWEVSSDHGSTWTAIEGATSSNLTLNAVNGSESGNEYRATFTNAAGSATTAAATLTVHAPPVITEQPASTTVQAGETATFTTAATGTPTPTVQWEESTNAGSTWTAVGGATSDTLTIENPVLGENGHEYRAKFTNVAGTATTAAATLTVANNHYSAVAWGNNLQRQLGDGSFEAFRDVPVGVVGLKFVEAVSGGGEHSLALLANGTVEAWGSDNQGQLGNGSEEGFFNTPVAVSGLSGVKAIAAGGQHSLALLSNGTVMAWGNNESGQLGNGTVTSSDVPVQVKGLTGVKAIAAGEDHSLALLNSGAVMAWGANESGQLGNGGLLASKVPVAVKGVTGATAIAAGEEFSLALVAGGAVDAWGNNEAGQLGEPEVELNSPTAVKVQGLTGATAIAAGANHAVALLSGGTVEGWGDDAAGQLCNGVFKASEPTPVAATGLTGVSGISAGGADTAAMLSGGTIFTCGADKWGQLGNGTTESSSNMPVEVQGIAKAADISVGHEHMLAFGEPMPVVAGVSPNDGPLAGGETVTISGADLTGATAVKFGANASPKFTVESATEITAEVPAATAAGAVDVVVTTPAGTSNKIAADRYTYVKPPTITKLVPKTGPVTAGTTVVITGTELATVTSATFGGVAAEKPTVNSNTQITVHAPAGSVGVVDVVLKSVGGSSAISTKDRYSYTPIVESLTPSEGPVAGGTGVTVTGTGFALGATATTFAFGTKKATSVSCTSSTTCTMVSPAATAAGAVNVIATVTKVKSPKAPGNVFTYH